MKKTFAAVAAAIAAIAALFTGCKSLPTIESMHDTAEAVGVAAGLIATQTKIDDASRNAAVDVLNEVVRCTPEPNQSFEEAWTPIAKAHVGKLIEEGKLDMAQGELVMSAFKLAVKGVDYLFEHRYPKAKQYKDLTAAGIGGFIGGFLSVFKPVNIADLASSAVKFDREAFELLSK